MLTRVTFICDDTKLGRACRALLGIAAEPPEVQPMANAMATKSGVTQRRGRNGATLPELIRSQMLEEKMERISASTIAVMAAALGYQAKSSAKAIQDLQHKLKFLRRVSRGEYEVRT